MTELITISNSAVDSAADKHLVTCVNQGEIPYKKSEYILKTKL